MSFQRSIDVAAAFQVDRLLDDARRASVAADRRVQLLDQGTGYRLRRITLTTGEELPFRRNPGIWKAWRVISGVGHGDIDEAEVVLIAGARVEIAPGALHQIENRGDAPLVLEERRVEVDATSALSD